MNPHAFPENTPLEPRSLTRWPAILVILGIAATAMFGYVAYEQERGSVETRPAARAPSSSRTTSSASRSYSRDSGVVDRSDETILTAIAMLDDEDEEMREGARVYLLEVGGDAVPHLRRAVEENRTARPERSRAALEILRVIVKRERDGSGSK